MSALPPKVVILCFLSYSKAFTWESHEELLAAPFFPRARRQPLKEYKRMAAGLGWPPFLHPIPCAVACPRGHGPVTCWDCFPHGCLPLASWFLSTCRCCRRPLEEALVQEALVLLWYFQSSFLREELMPRWCGPWDCCLAALTRAAFLSAWLLRALAGHEGVPQH